MNMRPFSIPRYHLDTGLLIGTLAGVAGIGFHFLADGFGALLFGWIKTNQAPISLLLAILVPTIGLCLVGLILQKVPSSTLGGVREVSEALDNHGAVIPFSRGLNVILSGLVLAFGGSVGPEGPMVQMGALIGSKVGQRFVVRTESLKTMVRAGAAAGIAGAFRSPGGGILLAVELFGARFNGDLPVIGIAAVVGYLTQTAILGREHPFGLPYDPQPLTLTGLLVIAPLMGLVAAPTGHLFIQMLAFAKQQFPKRWPLSIRVAVGGFLVGCIGIFYPHVMSTGYDVVVAGLGGRMNFEHCIVLLLL